MGRLQRYLRSLTPAEWEALRTDAQKEFRGQKTHSLIERLRRTSAPQTLTPAEKELAKRIERWIWKRAYIHEHQSHPIYKAPPPEWIRKGAQLYHTRGFSADALKVLQADSGSSSAKLPLLLYKLKIHMECGASRSAYETLREIDSLVESLKVSVQHNQLQIILWRLLREYGGSYTEVGKRFLRRLEKHPYWKRPRPIAPKERVIDANLRIMHALAQGNPSEGYELCLDESIRDHPAILLNRWMCSLFLRHSVGEYLLYDRLYESPLSPHDQEILFNRVLLTLLMYSSPGYIASKMPFLERWYVRLGSLPENQMVWLQLLWLCGRNEEAAHLSETLMERLRDRPFGYLQVALILLLIYAEAETWNRVIRHLRRLLQWLRGAQKVIASASILQKLLRRLYHARLRPQVLSEVADKWQNHLATYPTERYFWEITLLPDWIQARMYRQKISNHRQATSRALAAQLDILLEKASRSFTA